MRTGRNNNNNNICSTKHRYIDNANSNTSNSNNTNHTNTNQTIIIMIITIVTLVIIIIIIIVIIVIILMIIIIIIVDIPVITVASGGLKLRAVCSHGSRPKERSNAHGPGLIIIKAQICPLRIISEANLYGTASGYLPTLF